MLLFLIWVAFLRYFSLGVGVGLNGLNLSTGKIIGLISLYESGDLSIVFEQ